jgi:hypothetical protein
MNNNNNNIIINNSIKLINFFSKHEKVFGFKIIQNSLVKIY